MDLTVGTCFISWEESRNIVEDWSIRNQFEFQVLKKDPTRVSYACRYKSSGCPWRLYASYSSIHEIQIKTLHRDHSYAGLGTAAGGSSTSSTINQQSWLRRVVPQHLFVTKATSAQEIIDCMHIRYSHIPSYAAAWKVRKFLIQDG